MANSMIEPGNHPLNSIFISQLNSHLFASPLGSGLTACPPGIMAIPVMGSSKLEDTKIQQFFHKLEGIKTIL